MAQLLNNIRHGILANIWPWISMALIRLFGPRFAAYLTYLSIDWGNLRNTKTVICLYRESFIKDIHQLRIRGEFNYPVIMAGFTRFQMLWSQTEEQVQTFYQRSLSKTSKNYKKREKYVSYLLKLINKKIKVDAVLSANFDYWQDEPFKDYCKNTEIPFFVLSREHPIIPEVCSFVVNRYRSSNYHFNGSGIAVAGRSTKDVIEESCIVKDFNSVVITGLPRYDAWKDVDVTIELDKRRFITLLSFTQGYYADNTFVEVLNKFIIISNSYTLSEVDFLVKTKDARDTKIVNEIVQSSNIQANNLIISHEYDLFTILPLSKLVINYNSLSLVEALMAKTPIAIPAWGECKSKGSKSMYPEDDPEVSKVVNFIRNLEDLETYIDKALRDDLKLLDKEDIDHLVQKYVHISKKEGGNSYELEDFFTKSAFNAKTECL